MENAEKLVMTQELFEELSALSVSMLDDGGREMPSPKKMFLPGMKKPLSLKEQIQRLLRTELSAQVASQGYETFEEANDFDVKDDFETERESQYEMMEEEFPEEVVGKGEEIPRAPSEEEVPSEGVAEPVEPTEENKASE